MSRTPERFCTRVDALTILPDGAMNVTNPIQGNKYLVTGKKEKFLDEFGKQIYVPVKYVVEEIRESDGWHDYCRNGSYETFCTRQVHLFRAISDNTIIAKKDSEVSVRKVLSTEVDTAAGDIVARSTPVIYTS